MKSVLVAALALMPVSAQGATVEIDRQEVSPGQTVTVRLSGWPSGNVSVELCGNEGRRGTADCAVASSATTFVGPQGSATALLTVAKPPVGCPCVVSVRPVGGGQARTVPITVKGVKTLSESQRAEVDAAVPSLTVTSISLEGGGPSAAWFGGPADRTLVYTVKNDGDLPVSDAPVSIAVGRAPDPTGIVAAPALGTIEPGASKTFRVPVKLSGPAFGSYQIRGEIEGQAREIVFTAETSSYPWVWPFLLLVLVAAPGLRRRVPVAAPAASGAAATATVACPHCGGDLHLQLTHPAPEKPAAPAEPTDEAAADPRETRADRTAALDATAVLAQVAAEQRKGKHA
ncbi:hypothetical protein [Actinocorallia sp. A-T 12471]|uniref:hypothetical protein n=1 Tax=Actinocorallia sp. A-T 12471 TaxID=3089813 RepID=UPI0029CD9720|nr:hypothetical protein [Actinocorallia sp. A-T 12471]MDX6740284.1 hypothetical protein [Actinocorallia sp. A-T 12471]